MRAGADPVVWGLRFPKGTLERFRSASSAERAFDRSQTLKDNVCASPRPKREIFSPRGPSGKCPILATPQDYLPEAVVYEKGCYQHLCSDPGPRPFSGKPTFHSQSILCAPGANDAHRSPAGDPGLLPGPLPGRPRHAEVLLPMPLLRAPPPRDSLPIALSSLTG